MSMQYARPLIVCSLVQICQDVKNSQDITSESPGWLRVSVEGGGCSGFQYKLDLEEGELSLGDEDVVVEREGARVVVDQTSLEYLQVSRPHL